MVPRNEKHPTITLGALTELIDGTNYVAKIEVRSSSDIIKRSGNKDCILGGSKIEL